jgi:UDP-N-acetylglucosamine--N-acetylmuramyl-(pentapeptide) pyrophosphoryl-undecaprenol N-acetylglucosamine transferase
MTAGGKELRIIIAGGGTGGHVYPGISIYQALDSNCGNVEVLFIGARGGVEGGILARLELPYLPLPGRGIRGASLAKKIVAPFVLKLAVIKAMRAIIKFKPDVVLGTGGYASVSTIVAAMLCRKPRVLQEQNSIPGMANRWLSRIANLVLLSYAESQEYLRAGVPSVVVGNPLRFHPERRSCSRSEAFAFFGLEQNIPTIVIFGGSRGAHSINKAGVQLAKTMSGEGKAQIIFITGERDFEWIRQEVAPLAPRVKVLSFLYEMERAYIVADLAVARAGASSVFELAAFGVPTVFVPYPYAADDHQKYNVARLRELGAADILEDSQLTGDALTEKIRLLLDDTQKRIEMEERMRSWVKIDAAEQAAAAIMQLIKKKACEEVQARGAEANPATSCETNAVTSKLS